MLAKKRADAEIETFLSMYVGRIKNRLERILLRDLCTEVLQKTEDLVKEMIATIKNENSVMDNLEKSLAKLKEDTPIYSKRTSNTRSTVDLFVGEMEEVDGIEVFGSSDDDEDDEEENEH